MLQEINNSKASLNRAVNTWVATYPYYCNPYSFMLNASIRQKKLLKKSWQWCYIRLYIIYYKSLQIKRFCFEIIVKLLCSTWHGVESFRFDSRIVEEKGDASFAILFEKSCYWAKHWTGIWSTLLMNLNFEDLYSTFLGWYTCGALALSQCMIILLITLTVWCHRTCVLNRATLLSPRPAGTGRSAEYRNFAWRRPPHSDPPILARKYEK